MGGDLGNTSGVAPQTARLALSSDTALRLDDLPVMAWRSDPLGERVEFNEAWLAFTGRGREQVLADGWMEDVHPGDRQGTREGFRAALAESRSVRLHYRLRRADGRYRCVLEVARPCGRGGGYLGICLDVDEQAGDCHRVLAEHARDALLLLGGDGEVLEANSAAEEMYGHSRDELLGLHLRDVAPFDPAGPAGVPFETVHRRADGTRMAVEVSARAAEIAGRPVQVHAVRDITERNRMRQELSSSQSKYQALFDNMREGVAVNRLVRNGGGKPVDYTIAEVNPAFSVQTGIPHDQVIGRHASSAYDGGKAPCLEAFAEVVRAGVPASFEIYFEPLKCHFAVSAFSLGHDLFATVFSNITEHKKVEAQLRQAQKMEAVGRLAGGIAHDFNNLLTVILGYSDTLLESIPPESPLFDAVRSVKEAGERATRLTAQLLAFGRRQLLRPQVLNVNTVVRETGKMLKRLIGEDVQVSTVLAPDLGRVRVDAGQLTQVLLNLAVNSRDAMPRGGKLIVETSNTALDEEYARAHPGVRPGPYVMLAVSDTGSGMDAETQSHIFEPFFTTKPPGEGTGLGLSTVYGIVKQSGGEIGVYSEPGRGTSFKIYLPRVESEAAAQRGRAKRQPAGGGETILVVEDESAVAALVTAVLGRLGYRVVRASTAEEGLRQFREHAGAIQLVLSDVVLPGMSGPELARILEAERPGVPVLHMSGYPSRAAVSHGLALDRAHFLHKPFTAAELGEKVRALLDRKKGRRGKGR